VAASSFDMKVTDPKPFLDAIDQTRLKEILGGSLINMPKNGPIYVEPGPCSSVQLAAPNTDQVSSTAEGQIAEPPLDNVPVSLLLHSPDIRQGKVQRLGDFIDTDAVSARHRIVYKYILTTNSSHHLKFSLRALPTKNLGSIA
jgi:hypothetical protein